MQLHQLYVRLSLTALSTMCVGCALPKEPVTTFWQKMGVPQTMAGIHDNLVNRRGNHPGLERKPPLKSLADPANLESEVPAIKAAAEIKQAEDLAPQKVKAIKYLAEIGCGCYNKGGAVEKALLDALNDCTEEVRLAAAEAISESAAGGDCACNCNIGSCCGKEIQEKLMDLAYGETEGCWHEPSERVRQAAMQALLACPAVPVDDIGGGGEQIGPGREGEGTLPSNDENKAEETVPDDNIGIGGSEVPMVHVANLDGTKFVNSAPVQSESELWIAAEISGLSYANETLSIRFDKPYQFPIGLRMVITTDANGGEFEVVSSSTGSVEVRCLEGVTMLRGLQPSAQIQVGILDNN